jgi:hypothetical protein
MYTNFSRKSDAKIQLGRRRSRLENYYKMDLKETGCEVLNLNSSALA